MKMLAAPQLVGEIRAILGEGPVWDGRNARLCWVDIFGKTIHETGLDGSEDTIELPSEPGCAVLDGDGNFVAAVEHALIRVNRANGSCVPLASLDAPDRLRFNDGKCDPAGRLWVGTMDREESDPLGALYCYTSGGFELRQPGITVANGLGWSPCGKWMYYIDSPRREVWRFQFELETGLIEDRQVLSSFAKTDGFPDGMAVDGEGHLWVAFWEGGKVLRLDAQSGDTIARLDLPASKVTSCAFGGADLSQLFVTTARVGLAEDEEPLAGRLFVADPGVIGTAVAGFSG